MIPCEELDLIGYKEGVLSERELRRVEEHLSSCPDCQRRLGELDDTARILLDVWVEGGLLCPPAEALQDYSVGEGSPQARRVLERHLEKCPSCLEALEVLKAFQAGWRPEHESPELPEALGQRLSGLKREGLLERLRRAAEAALGREGRGAVDAWLESLKSRRPEAWPLAALPRDAAEVEEQDEQDEEESR